MGQPLAWVQSLTDESPHSLVIKLNSPHVTSNGIKMKCNEISLCCKEEHDGNVSEQFANLDKLHK